MRYEQSLVVGLVPEFPVVIAAILVGYLVAVLSLPTESTLRESKLEFKESIHKPLLAVVIATALQLSQHLVGIIPQELSVHVNKLAAL